LAVRVSSARMRSARARMSVVTSLAEEEVDGVEIWRALGRRCDQKR
jgi:hypothetical protein